MSNSLLKVSSQGVRDFKVKPSENANDDIGDVYDDNPAKAPPRIESSKPSVSSNGTVKKKKIGYKNKTLKGNMGVTTLTKKDMILRAHLDNLNDEEQLQYLKNENDSARNMINDLMEAFKTTISSFRTTHKPVPKADFTKRSEDVEEIEQKLKKYSKEISLNRRLLSNSYNIQEIESMEGAIRVKNTKISKMKKANKEIRKWIKKNEKDKANINENGFYDDELYKLKNQYREDKAKLREIYYDNLARRKGIIQHHETVVKMDTNIKRMKELIYIKRRDKLQQSQNADLARSERVVTGQAWDVDEMKKKVDSAKNKLRKEQDHIDQESNLQEDKIRELEHQVKICSIKVKEKDKELSLAHLKIRELQRNSRHQSLKPLSSTPRNLTSRKGSNLLGHKSIDASLVKKRGNKSRFSGKRNSTDDYTRNSSNN